MKKRVYGAAGHRGMTAIAALAAAALLTACGSKEYLKDIKAADYVTLGNYIGVEASATEPSVSDGLVDMYIENYLLPSMAETEEVTGRAVQDGDTVNIDFVGYMDGETFDGGSSEGYELTIGSHAFIDGFEEGLVGTNIGDTVSLELSFPDNYQNADLAGKPVTFEVTVNSIGVKKAPELTDELVQTMGIADCTTVQGLRDYIYQYFYDSAAEEYNNKIEAEITDTVMADCTFKEPPADLVDRLYQNIVDAVTTQASVSGMTLAEYMQQYYQMDEAAYTESFRSDALNLAQQSIMFQSIADAEGLNPTDEQVQAEITNRVQTYNYESEEAYRESNDVELLKEQMMERNVMEFLKENANIQAVPAADAAAGSSAGQDAAADAGTDTDE